MGTGRWPWRPHSGCVMSALIEAATLRKLYRMGDETVRALDGVSFVIARGDYCAIVGALALVSRRS